MGYKIVKQNDDITYNVCDFIVDAEADISSVPTTCEAGSKIYVAGTSDTYILNTLKQWIKQINSGGGGGGGGTAASTTYNNTESGLEATNVQDALDEIVEGVVFHDGGEATEITPESITAEEVAYDNTESGLDAIDVQAALDELAQGGGGGDGKMIKEIDFDGGWIIGNSALFPSMYGNSTIPINSLDIDDIDKVFNSTNTDMIKILKKMSDGGFILTPESFEFMKLAITSGWMQIIPASNDSLNWVLYNEDTFFASFFKYDVIKEYDLGSEEGMSNKIREYRLPITISMREKGLTYDAILVLTSKAMSMEKGDIVFKQIMLTGLACFCDIGKGIISIDQEESFVLSEEYEDFIIPPQSYGLALYASFNTPNVIAVPISATTSGGGSTEGMVRYDESQSLSTSEKERARNNIGAASDSDMPYDAVRYNTGQSLTDTQKERARNNIGAASASDIPSGTVRYDTSQSLTDTQKSRARSNISAISINDIPSDIVRYDTNQSLTNAQKIQARSNIGVVEYRLDGDTLYID